MTVMHAWALGIGVAALALPVAIHLLTRPRPRRLALSTIRFVREAIEQRRARHRLRDAIILSLRTLAILLLCFAFARPLLRDQTPPPTAARPDASTVRIVMLDCSQSMAASTRGLTSFERGRAQAAQRLSDLHGGRVNLILAAAQPRAVLERPGTNHEELTVELGRAAVLPQRLDVRAAVTLAAEMFRRAGDAGAPAAGEEPRRELLIVSDFQRANWASADLTPLPADVAIHMLSVAPEAPPPNLAILRAGVRGRCEQGRPAELNVEIGNFSDTPRQVAVDAALGDATYHLQGLCPAQSKTMLVAAFEPRTAGWQAGFARLTGIEDSLAPDNARDFVVNVQVAPVYGLVTREAAQPAPTSTHFLERALAPNSGPRPGVGERVARLAPDQLDRQIISTVDLLVLDHPGKLSAEAAQLLAALLRRGKSMLYVASEPVDAVNLQRLADALGPDFNPPVLFQPPTAGAVQASRFVTQVRQEDTPFAVFGDGLMAALGPLRFDGALVSRRRDGGIDDDVLAMYSDRSAFLTVTGCGAGTLAVLNADLARSNLPASPVFVPLIGELVSRLLRQHEATAPQASGTAMAVFLPTEAGPAANLRIVEPHPTGSDTSTAQGESDTAASLGSLADDKTWTIWRWPSAGPPGVYRVQRGAQTVFALATELPAEESDLQSLDVAVMRDRLAVGRTVHAQSANAPPASDPDALWSRLALACALCLLAEVLALSLMKT